MIVRIRGFEDKGHYKLNLEFEDGNNKEQYTIYAGRRDAILIIHLLASSGKTLHLDIDRLEISYEVNDQKLIDLLKAIILSPKITQKILENPSNVLEDYERFRDGIEYDRDGISVWTNENDDYILVKYRDDVAKIFLELSFRKIDEKYRWKFYKNLYENPTKVVIDHISRGIMGLSIDVDKSSGYVVVKDDVMGDMNRMVRQALIMAIKNRIFLTEALAIVSPFK